MTMPPQTDPLDPIIAAVRSHRQRFTILGAVLVILGILAIAFPLLGSIAVKLVLGWFLLATGASLLFAAFQMRDWQSAIWTGLIGLLQLAAGVYLAFFPLTGLIGLTLFMGVVFLFQGAAEATMALQHRPRDGWGWLAVSALASIVLGVLLIAGLPGTAIWALGLFLGINLISSGVSFVALARNT
jgi:uncharacterized membrane protein HdeD (DUF308 family)